MGKIDTAVSWAVGIANDNSHGYSQANRWGPNYDCSSLVIQAWENAGVPVKSRGASFTGNMRSVFISCGFVDVTYSVGLSSGYGLQKGDVLLNEAAHTAMYIGNGRVVHARSSEGNSISGDQSGNEVRTQNYWNFPWNCVLRYKENSGYMESDVDTTVSEPVQKPQSNLLRMGSTGEKVKQLQEKLIAAGYDVGSCGADGEFGRGTYAAVLKFQKDNNLEADGVAGPATMAALEKSGKKPTEEPSVVVVEPDKNGSTSYDAQDSETHDWKPPVLQISSAYSDNAVVLQALLNVRGFKLGEVDGFFGAKTQAMVNKAQRFYDLPVTGICDEKLWAKLLEV